MQRAGHLLGSAYVECDVSYPGAELKSRVVFSGDLRAPCNSLLRAVRPPERADILIIESTYGDRLHPDCSNRQQCLESAIDRALADSGTILIPAFSLGRTQQLFYEIEGILYRKSLLNEFQQGQGGGSFAVLDWSQLPVILDSPLAQRITRAYSDLHEYWSCEARRRLGEGRDPLGFGQLVCIDTHAMHRQVVNYLMSTGRPAIVIAGNGMCSGGRIVSYLNATLGDSRHEVIFVGYQAKGTAGAAIRASEGVQGFLQVDMDRRMYGVRAKETSFGGYSAHAEQEGVVAFAAASAPAKMILVHGKAKARAALASKLRERAVFAGIPWEVEIP